LLGTFAGHLAITSPVELLLPAEMRSNGFVQSLVRPYAAQIMDVGSGLVPRPAAPWGYTNTWGHNFLLLVGWFIAGLWLAARRAGAPVLVAGCGAAVLALACLPVVTSLNRGLWIGLLVVTAVTVLRLVRRGRLTPLLMTLAAALAVAALLATTSLGGTVANRLANGHSDGVRSYLTERALAGAAESPVIGFG